MYGGCHRYYVYKDFNSIMPLEIDWEYFGVDHVK